MMAHDLGFPYLSDDDVLSIDLRNKGDPDSDVGRLLAERDALLSDLAEATAHNAALEMMLSAQGG